jgi:hypothetical protein
MRSATNVVIVISFLWLLVSFWNRNELPGSIDYIAGIANEPQQTGTDRRSFEAVWDGVAYRVDPEYDYDLVGMIVSFRHHDENSRMHRLADDHLNMLDVCVVWGNNTSGAQLDKIDFWNGIFTCNVKTRDQAAWESFDMYQLSNNHLISDDDFIRDQVRKVKVGDQAPADFAGPVRHAPIREMVRAKQSMLIASKFCNPQPVTGAFRCMRLLQHYQSGCFSSFAGPLSRICIDAQG